MTILRCRDFIVVFIEVAPKFDRVFAGVTLVSKIIQIPQTIFKQKIFITPFLQLYFRHIESTPSLGYVQHQVKFEGRLPVLPEEDPHLLYGDRIQAQLAQEPEVPIPFLYSQFLPTCNPCINIFIVHSSISTISRHFL